MKDLSTNKKRSMIIICALLLILCLVIHEVFLCLGNYIMTNYSGDVEHVPAILIPFAPDGIIQQLFFMSVLFLVPYILLVSFGIMWLRKALWLRIKFYLYGSIFCGTTMILYLFMRWYYIFEPLITNEEGYPYMSLLEVFIDF